MNKVLFFFLFIFLIGCAHLKNESQPYLTFACTIYDLNGNIVRNYGGDHCIFEQDGSYLIADNDGTLSLKNLNNKTLWSLKDIRVHHEMTKNNDGNYLVISSKFTEDNIRYDVFFLISKTDGKILSELSTLKLYSVDNVFPREMVKQQIWINFSNNSKLELCHANSIYQVEDIKDENNFIKKGDYVLNILGKKRAILLLNSDFSFKQRFIPEPYILHDVQVLPDGSFIYFDNVAGSGEIKRNEYMKLRELSKGSSKVIIYDPKSNSSSSYFSETTPHFIMYEGGSIQLLPEDKILTTDSSGGHLSAIYADKKGNILKKVQLKDTKLGFIYIKQQNLQGFLDKNIGL